MDNLERKPELGGLLAELMDGSFPHPGISRHAVDHSLLSLGKLDQALHDRLVDGFEIGKLFIQRIESMNFKAWGKVGDRRVLPSA
jgi:hypothetical protein